MLADIAHSELLLTKIYNEIGLINSKIYMEAFKLQDEALKQ